MTTMYNGIMNIKGSITINTAAKLLGVSTRTLMRWDANGKFSPKNRHPINNYRLYFKKDVLDLKKKIEGK